MLELKIKNKNEEFTVGRKTNLKFNVINNDNNYIDYYYDNYADTVNLATVLFKSLSNVRTGYTMYIKNKITENYNTYKGLYVRSIGGVPCTFNSFSIFTQGALAVQNEYDEHSIKLIRTHASRFALDQLFKRINELLTKIEYHKIYAMQFCLYHRVCTLLYKLLRETPPYGLTLNYIGTQTKYNLTVYQKDFDPEIVSTPNAVYIRPYFKNSSCSEATLNISVKITGTPRNPNYYCIYLQQADKYTNIDDDGNASYSIYKQGINVTDPNACDWRTVSRVEPFGEIYISSVTIEPHSSFSAVFSIMRNININGFTSLGALSGSGMSPALFHVTIDYTIRYTDDPSAEIRYTHIGDCRMEQIIAGDPKWGDNINGIGGKQ